MICDNLVFSWLIERVELFGCAWIGAVDTAARCDKEGAAGDGAADGAALVDAHRHQAIHKVALAHGAAIGGEQLERRP